MPLQTMAWDKIPGRGGGALDVRTGVLEAIMDEAYIWKTCRNNIRGAGGCWRGGICSYGCGELSCKGVALGKPKPLIWVPSLSPSPAWTDRLIASTHDDRCRESYLGPL